MPVIYETKELEFSYNRAPFRVYLHHLEGVNIYTVLHWHQNVEFSLTTKGRILSTIGTETFVVGENEWSITNSGVFHSNHWVHPDDVYEGTVVQISKQMIDEWFGKDAYFTVPSKEEEKAAIREVLREIGEAIRTDADEFRQMELLFKLFSRLNAYSVQKNVKGPYDRLAIDKIKEILIYVDQHYNENIDLSSVAQAFHYSPEHLARLFKKNTGVTFHQHLQTTRLMEAIHALQRNPDMKLLDCAVEHGFPNVKSFIQTFKQNVGYTPSEWKKRRETLVSP